MNNADKPAFPNPELGIPTSFDRSNDYGLTKRERFAMAAMQGLCASESDSVWYKPEDLAKESVKRADALLKELEQ